MSQILNGYDNIDSNIFFEIKITRGLNFTLVKKQSRLDVRKFSFSQRTINTASVAEWLRAWDTLTMFEATVCGRS